MKWKFVLLGGLLAVRLVWADANVTIEDLQSMTQPELDRLYAQSEPGPLPSGNFSGYALFFPGSPWEGLTERVLRVFWQGKIFDLQDDVVTNEVVGLRGVLGVLGYGASHLDGKTSIVISYQEKTHYFRRVTDELRLVGPGLYLGRAYFKKRNGVSRLWANFVLQLP